MTPKNYRFVRVTPDTHHKLRILAAQSGESIIDLIDRLATEEQETISMTSKKYSRRQHIIEKVAERIYNAQWDNDQITAANNHGFTFDIRFQDGEYIGDSWSEVSNITLTPDELEEAKRIATTF